MITYLSIGFYYKKYNSPFSEPPIGPFKNEEDAIKAAGGLYVPESEFFSIIRVPFDNWAWGP